MIEWPIHFALKLLETFRDILPIATVIIGFQLIGYSQAPTPSQKNAGWFHLCFTRHCFFSERAGYGFISAWELDGIPIDHS